MREMGSSGSGGGDAGLCGVGSIVWVRRRNGSWWPGKILGQEELSSTHLTSPRSGTPVKLLGRDDASVDWYNLEKSKRVKAFRCGEFDDCIERAEASQGMPAKKREKYARREDAILHALELEKQLLRKQGKVAVTPDPARSNSSDSVKKEVKTPSEALYIDSGKPAVSESNQQLKRLDSSPQDESVDSPLDSKKTAERELPDGVHVPAEVLPRLRVLEDFVHRPTSQKRKFSTSGASDGCKKAEVNSKLQTPAIYGPSMERTIHANGGEHTEGILRAKRSKYLYLPTESDETLDHKEIPQSRMSAFHFEEGDSCPPGGFAIEENSSGFMEDDEPDSSDSESETEVDSSETEPDLNEDMAVHSGSSVPREAEYRFQSLGERRSLSSEEHDDLMLPGNMYLHSHDPYSANEAVSKWQLKGKRNVRNISMRSSMDATDARAFNGPLHGLNPGEKGAAFTRTPLGRSLSFWRKDDVSDVLDEAELDDRDFCNQQMFALNAGYSSTSRGALKFQSPYMIDRHHVTWEDHQPFIRGHVNPRLLGHYNYGNRARPMLIDVDLQVEASYKKALVPIISLTSKLDGKSIIGHPIQVEVLDDGSSESLIAANDIYGNELGDHDGSGMLPPAWRTARRTNFRVPRPDLSSSPGNGEMSPESHYFVDEERRQTKKSSMGSSSHKENTVKRSPRPTLGRKSPKKVGKKVNSSLGQKTRTLSSIGINHNQSHSRFMYDSNDRQINGLMKPETSTVACIPVKLVFSRLLEKINRPASKLPSKPVVLSSDAERNQNRSET